MKIICTRLPLLLLAVLCVAFTGCRSTDEAARYLDKLAANTRAASAVLGTVAQSVRQADAAAQTASDKSDKSDKSDDKNPTHTTK